MNVVDLIRNAFPFDPIPERSTVVEDTYCVEHLHEMSTSTAMLSTSTSTNRTGWEKEVRWFLGQAVGCDVILWIFADVDFD